MSIPTAAQSGVKAMAAGQEHSLALKEDGTVLAWGRNNTGQSSVPAGLSGVEAISAGELHSLALKDNRAPAVVDSFAADAGDGEVSLSWDNPSTTDFKAVRILRSSTTHATSPGPNAEQTKVFEGSDELFTDTGLTNGTPYHYTIYAVDDAGNYSRRALSSATPQEITAPDTTITDGPSGTVNSASATFTFTSSENGSTFECKLDGGEFAACQTGKTYENLSDGSHTFSVRAKNAAGNTDETPASRTWIVDATAPNTKITSGPTEGSTVASGDQTFSFTSSEGDSTFECSVNNGATYQPCSSGATFTYTEGSNTFKVKATDAAGNQDQTPDSRAFTVDATDPDAPSINSPDDNSFDTDGTITLSGAAEANTTVEVFEGDDSRGSTTANGRGEWSKTLTGVADGSHTYKAKATDAAGNSSDFSNTRTVTVDTAAPDTTITSGPSEGAKVNATSQAFSFTSTEASSTFRCSINGAAFSACSSGDTFTFTEGPNTFEVKATDAAGNEDSSAATRAFVVDTTPPDTTAPTVTTTTPAGKHVLRNTLVTATFSESMNRAIIEAAGTVTLVLNGQRGQTTLVTATVGYDPDTKTVTLDPSSDLDRNATYTARITTSAKDAAGNALAQPKTWTFVTAVFRKTELSEYRAISHQHSAISQNKKLSAE